MNHFAETHDEFLIKILEQVKKNSIRADELSRYLHKITPQQLSSAGIPNDVIEKLLEQDRPIQLLKPRNKMPIRGFTDIYLWGTPSSGKTCAMGALLATADRMGIPSASVQNGLYASQLKNRFQKINSLSYLPEASADIQLVTNKYIIDKKKTMDVDFIDLTGEVMKDIIEQRQHSSNTAHGSLRLEALSHCLKNSNHKIHLFFVGYGDHDSIDRSGLRKIDYLNNVIDYINDLKGFHSTDKIFLILSKSDKICVDTKASVIRNPSGGNDKTSELDHIINNYLAANYSTLLSRLKYICEEKGINPPLIMPYSIGEVYFHQICRFNDTDSRKLINALSEAIMSQKSGFFSRLISKIK